MSVKTDMQAEVYNDLLNTDETFAAVLNKQTKATYDAENDSYTTETSTNYTCRLLWDELKAGFGKQGGVPEGIEIKVGDSFGHLATQGQVPLNADKLVVSGITYSVLFALDEVVGMDALFKVWLR